MILNALNTLYDRLKNDPSYEISAPGFSLQGIAFAIVIDSSGNLLDIEDVRITEGKKTTPRKLQVLGRNKPSGSGLNPTFLWDTTAYLLGFSTDETKKSRNVECFYAFRDYHLSLENEIDQSDFHAVCNFLRSWDPRSFDVSHYEFLTKLVGGYGAFKIAGKTGYVHENKEIEKWYLSKCLEPDSSMDVIAQSLISGQPGAIASTQGKIKGIGEKAATLVGFNAKPYESYGKEQAFNAPVSKEEEFRYTVALNSLTDGPMRSKHMVNLGDMKVVFWAEQGSIVEDCFGLLCAGQAGVDPVAQHKLQAVFDSFRSGSFANLQENLDVPFYVLGLSVNVTRVVVRFFTQSTVGSVLDHFKLHFDQMRMQKNFPSDPDFPTVRQILDQTCPLKSSLPDRDHIPANLQGMLFRDIISGTRYPAGVYNRIIHRFQRDHYQDFIKVSFIKAFFIRNYRKEFSMSLDSSESNPGYLCGRLFALLVKTQKDAQGDTTSTIRESYMASASSRPGSVFPRLLSLYQHHYAKLDNGAKVGKDILMQEIMGKLGTTFPASLGYQDQGAFAIGFNHQMQAFYTKKELPAESN